METSQNNTKPYSKKLWGYIGQYKHLAIPGLLCIMTIAAAGISQPLILKEIIDKAVPAKDTALLAKYALLYLGIVLASGVLSYYGSILLSKMGLSIVTNIKQDLFSHLLKLPISYLDAHPVGELMSRTENDTEKIRDLFSNIGVTLIVSILSMVGIFIVTFTLAPALAGVMLVATLTFLLILLFFFNKLIKLYDKSRSLYAKVVAKVTEFVQGIEIVKVFNRAKWAADSLEQTGKEKKDVDIKTSMFEYSAMSALDSLVGPIFIVALIVLYSPKILSGGMSLGTLVLFFEYGSALLRPVVQIAESIRSMQQSKTSLRRILAIMAIPEEEGKQNEKLPTFENEIRFDHVWFAYKEEEWVVSDLSFTVPKGSMTAVVGASGSGKSTTVGLLCGFYRPQKGTIYIDEVPLAELNLEAWRKKIGLVLQDVYLFPGSVLENVRVYNDDISQETVESALETVQAMDTVKSLPQGLSTNLWERGGNLSAGEKQLFAFARALAVNPELVILDEAMSNVDMETEKKITHSLAKLLEDRSALIVAHRLSSILHADQILFFSDGKIIAKGTHDELLEKLPEYHELVQQQFIQRSGE
ncbi:MAG: ABC transporter ATP-binding protein/permease [Spirochaetaceae bacterium]|nr:ABC transporter ATP-binding protein/permease [Spirochaetaceae bacterium]